MNVLDPLTWSILLLIAGCALAILEVFLPSAGMLAFMASAAVLASIGLAFYHEGPTTGFAFSAVAVVVLPAAIALALKYWPHTPMGKRFLLALPSDEEVLDVKRQSELKQLVGKIGVATCPMLPSGAVKIDNLVIDAVSQGMPIDKGQRVKVVEARAYRIVVRPVEEDEAGPEPPSDDPLAKSLEDFGLEPLDDPLA